MQLAKVRHWRCGDPAGTTLVWAPDDMTFDQFRAAVSRAEDAYLKFAKEWPNLATVPNPGYQPNYKAFPDLTVREVEAQFEAAKQAYNAAEAERNKGYKSFGDYLTEEGLTSFWNVEPELGIDADWGHNHRLHLELSETEIKDLPGPLDRVELF